MEIDMKKPAAERQGDSKDLPLGKDELNLAEFPIALLGEKAPHGVRTLEFRDQIFDGGKKKLLNRKLTIEGSETYGLPTAKDDEVVLALIQLSKRTRFNERTIYFTRFELINLLGWSNTGQSYSRVELSLRRWVSVTLHYENAWWDKSEQRWTSGAFHVIDEFELNDGRESTPQMTPLASRVVWSSRVFGSFVEGHLKNIRYDIYVKLRSAISKRMYRFLDKRFHHAESCSFDLKNFAHEHVGLSRSYRDCGKLKEKLDVGVKELEAIGFLEPTAGEERYRNEGRGLWRVTFTRGRGGRKSPSASPAGESEPSDLVAELSRRGMTTTTAQGLARRYPAERIQRQIESFDWLTEKTPGKIGEPGGYLVDAITKDYAVPKGFIPQAERRRREEARREKERREAEQRRLKQAVDDQTRRENEQVAAYWEGLSDEQKAAHDADAVAQADAEELELIRQPGLLKRLGMTILRDNYTRKLLRLPRRDG
jgi:hypothetical protein